MALSCVLALSASNVYGIRLNEENKLNYQFQTLNVISGDVIDY